MNFTRNEILNDPASKTPEALKNLALFDRVERTRLEYGQPAAMRICPLTTI